MAAGEQPSGQAGPNRARSLEQYRRVARGYDRHMWFATATRRAAVRRLALRPGDVVLDVGCGTGLSFSLIEKRIGTEGRLMGMEPSPDMLAQARDRVGREGWRNVTLLETGAEDARLDAAVDAVLFFFVHDVMRSRAALENVFRQVRPGARVAAAGGKWAPRWALPVNAIVGREAHEYVTTMEDFDRPWTLLAEFVPGLRVRSIVLAGAGYLAWGTAAPGSH